MTDYELADQYYEQPSNKPLFNKPKQEENLLKELFDFENDIDKLSHIWNGDKQDDRGDWIINKDPKKAIMNEDGIHWCKSKLKSFTGKYFVVTSFSATDINEMMKIHAKDINHELSKRYVEFGFKDKLDIYSVWSNMITAILAIFKGTFADAQRKLLGTTNTHQVVEHKDSTPKKTWLGGQQ